MDVTLALPLLGGLSPAVFMRRHWQKKPLLVRQAWPEVQPPLPRAALFDLAARDDVESRLIEKRAGDPSTPSGWRVRQGPLPRRALPPVSRAGWTLLVQGLDLHVAAAACMLQAFRFVPDARLDDLMVSWASAGGGVGPHLDSYDVFLLQVQGRRRWRIGNSADRTLQDGAPLKLLRHFQPTHDWLLEPGDMLYLPPGWGHDGVAEGADCMTCSIGFRAPAADELARELLLRLSDDADDRVAAAALYRDPRQAASPTPAELPADLAAFARQALQRRLAEPLALERVLGELLTEPKPRVWFDGTDGADGADRTGAAAGTLRLDARTRMLYDAHHIFINGEAFAASGRDATLMRRLADARTLSAPDRKRLSVGAAELVAGWVQSGWLHRDTA